MITSTPFLMPVPSARTLAVPWLSSLVITGSQTAAASMLTFWIEVTMSAWDRLMNWMSLVVSPPF
jgi:hypothetical protein